AHSNTLRQIGQTRHAQAIHTQAARQHQIDNVWGPEQDKQAIDAIKKDLPQFTRDDASLDRLRAATRKAMTNIGWSKVAVFLTEQFVEHGAAIIPRLANSIATVHSACNFANPCTDVLVRALLRSLKSKKSGVDTK